MFYLPEFSGFFIIILPCSEKVFFMGKCRFIDIWHACPELKQKLSISDYNVIILFFVRTIHYC